MTSSWNADPGAEPSSRDGLHKAAPPQGGRRSPNNDKGVMSNDSAADSHIWWLNPRAFVTAFCVVPFLLVFVGMAQDSDELFTIRSHLYLDSSSLMLGLAFFAAFMLGAAYFAPSRDYLPQYDGNSGTGGIRDGFLDFLALTTIGAYLIWFHAPFADPMGVLQSLIHGRVVSEVRAGSPTIAGITTMTQFGDAYAILLIGSLALGATYPKRFKIYFVAIGLLTVFRVFYWSERLALLEIALPCAIMATRLPAVRDNPRVRRLLGIAPIIGILALPVYFGATEYFRSWSGFYAARNSNFFGFALGRLGTYYATSLNNGFGQMQVMPWPSYSFTDLLFALKHFPLGVGDYLMNLLPPETQDDFLVKFADPEFNTFAPVFEIFFEVGVPLGLLLVALWGACCGAAYRGFELARGVGYYVFPLMFISMAEMLRQTYITFSRVQPTLIAIVIGALWFRLPQGAPDASRDPA
jgi:hypothetical protein